MNLPRRPLGSSGVEITVLGFGSWALGGGGWATAGGRKTTPHRSRPCGTRQLGINWIHTAAVLCSCLWRRCAGLALAAHRSEIGVDGRRLAVVGNSVGGNMAAVVSLMAKDRGTPNLRFQLLFWPVTNARFDTASYQQFAEGHFLTRNMIKWFWDHYTSDQRERQDVYASPLQASIKRLKGLTPVLIRTAEMDVLRDEGEAYARRLDQAGVDVIHALQRPDPRLRAAQSH